MIPADQRLEAANAMLRQVVERLVVKLELLVLHGGTQIGLQRMAGLYLLVHLAGEETFVPAPVGLGVGKSDRRVAQQLVGLDSIVRGYRNAHGNAEFHLLLAAEEGFAELATDLVGKRGDVPRLLAASLQDRKFVRAETGKDILRACRGADALCHLLQDLVAGRNTKRVVDRLEPVEIEMH